MALSDAEVIRDQYAAVNERDWPRSMSHYAEDVELVVSSGIMAGTHKGRDAVGAWFGDWFSSFARDARFDITELTELDDGSILLVADHHASGRASGIEVEDTVHWRYHLRNGKITHVRGFETREDALPQD
jgi:ketosteroid isomerase-like protein